MSGEAPELEGGQSSSDPPPAVEVPKAPTRVFISYASQDATVAQRLCTALEAAGFPCWIAPRDVRAGESYAGAIVQAINSCRMMVLVLSQGAIASPHVLREVERASSKRRPVLSVRLDATRLPPDLEYFLSANQWLDASAKSIEQILPVLVESVRNHEGGMNGQALGASSRAAGILPGAVTGSIKSPFGWRLRATAIALAVAAVGLAYVLTNKLWLSKQIASGQAKTAATNVVSDKSIAVLPFVDLSEKHDQEYFGDGMAEEVIDRLVNIPGLRVIGRTSSFQFKGRNPDLRTVGEQLGVNYVVEGSVRKSADHVRVTAQLIDARDASHLWSETYDRSADDALRTQGEIATSLSRSLEVGIGADRAQSEGRLKNDTAYDLYLRGRFAAERGDADGMATGITYLRQALDADPSFSDAAVALALTYYDQAFESLEPSGVFESARHAAASALTLNPKLGLAHAILGAIHNDYDWDWTGADLEFKQAIALAPHDGRVLTMAADHVIALGQLDPARQMLKQALAYDPLLADAYSELAWTEWCAGRYEESLIAARKVLEIDPTYDWGHVSVGQALLYRGDAAAAITEFKLQSNLMEQASGLSLAYHALSRATDSNAALTRLISGGSANYAYEIAEVYAYRGERDESLKWLERAYVQKDATLKWIARDPTMTNLQSDPRYKTFLRKMNLPE
jgi:TolB-like protein/Tfp pilus assembly protein PilF